MMEMFHRYQKSERVPETRAAPSATHVLVLAHNNRDARDPEHLAALVKADDAYHAKKQREQQRKNPANENEKEVLDKHSSAA
jgi:hypothetical protein